jgi:hypothetical protein
MVKRQKRKLRSIYTRDFWDSPKELILGNVEHKKIIRMRDKYKRRKALRMVNRIEVFL